MSIPEPLYLSARVQSLLAKDRYGSEALDDVPHVDKQLRDIGWRRALVEEVGDAAFYGDLCCFAIADGEDAARRAIAQLSSFLDLNAKHVRVRSCLIQAWEVSETMDRLRKGLTVRWSRSSAFRTDRNSHPNVVLFRPRWACK